MRGFRPRCGAVGQRCDLDDRRGDRFQRGRTDHEPSDNDRRIHHGRPNNNSAADHCHDAVDNGCPSHHGRPNNNSAADHYLDAADHYHHRSAPA